jgi:hypothetical protein
MNPDDAPTPGYQSYLLRCWCVHAHQATPRLRFSLVHTRTGVRRGFDDFDTLVAFLRQQIDSFTLDNVAPGNDDASM